MAVSSQSLLSPKWVDPRRRVGFSLVVGVDARRQAHIANGRFTISFRGISGTFHRIVTKAIRVEAAVDVLAGVSCCGVHSITGTTLVSTRFAAPRPWKQAVVVGERVTNRTSAIHPPRRRG